MLFFKFFTNIRCRSQLNGKLEPPIGYDVQLAHVVFIVSSLEELKKQTCWQMPCSVYLKNLHVHKQNETTYRKYFKNHYQNKKMSFHPFTFPFPAGKALQLRLVHHKFTIQKKWSSHLPKVERAEYSALIWSCRLNSYVGPGWALFCIIALLANSPNWNVDEKKQNKTGRINTREKNSDIFAPSTKNYYQFCTSSQSEAAQPSHMG